MARFSEGFLTALTTPGMAEDARRVGRALGGVPAQYAQQKKKKEDEQKQKEMARQLMSARSSQNPATMRAAAEKLLEAGQTEQATKLSQAADKLEAEQKLTQGERALVKFSTARGRNMRDPIQKEAFFRMANVYGVDPTRSSELYEQFVEPKEEGFTLTPGASRFDPEGNLVATAAFKPADTPAPKINIVRGTKDDPNIRVFRNGQLVETIKTKLEGETLEAAEKRLSAVSEFVRIKDDVTTLMGDEYMASGITGAIFAQWLPGSDARDRDRIIFSLKSNLGLTQIQKLKELSSTGSTGLGQVSNLELNALQSAVAALDVSMSEEAQMRSLKKIFGHLDRAQKMASGVIPREAIPWNEPSYRAAGYSKDTNTGEVFYAPFGPDGQLYHLVEGEFKPI